MDYILLIENRPGNVCSESFIVMSEKEFDLLKKESNERLKSVIKEFGSYFIVSDGGIVLQEIHTFGEYWNSIHIKIIHKEEVDKIKYLFGLESEPILRFGMNKFFFPVL